MDFSRLCCKPSGGADDATEPAEGQHSEQFNITGATTTVVDDGAKGLAEGSSCPTRTAFEEQQFDSTTARVSSELPADARDVLRDSRR